MKDTPNLNRRWILKSRPKPGPLSTDIFSLEEAAIPELKPGEYLVKNQLLSFDPTQRIWMTADSYVPKIQTGTVMRSLGLGSVVASKNDDFPEGATVSGLLGWQDYSLRDGTDLFPDSLVPNGVEDTASLSIFGLTGLTIYFGMVDVRHIKPGDVVLVSGASGATGSIAAQIAKLEGAKKVIGIAGGPKKCAWLLEKAGIDAAIDYKNEDIAERLSAEAPDGIDLYFDNVGGKTLDIALANLSLNARVVLCGAISTYDGSDGAIHNYLNLVLQRATMRGFLFSDHLHLADTAIKKFVSWLSAGKMCYEVDVQEDLLNAPKTLQRLFEGANLGKQLLRL